MPKDPEFVALVERNLAQADSDVRTLVAEAGSKLVVPKPRKRLKPPKAHVAPRAPHSSPKNGYARREPREIIDFDPDKLVSVDDTGRKMSNEFVNECWLAYCSGQSVAEVLNDRFHRLEMKSMTSARVTLTNEFKRRGYKVRPKSKVHLVPPVQAPVREPEKPVRSFSSFDAAEYARFLSAKHRELDMTSHRG